MSKRKKRLLPSGFTSQGRFSKNELNRQYKNPMLCMGEKGDKKLCFFFFSLYLGEGKRKYWKYAIKLTPKGYLSKKDCHAYCYRKVKKIYMKWLKINHIHIDKFKNNKGEIILDWSFK